MSGSYQSFLVEKKNSGAEFFSFGFPQLISIIIFICRTFGLQQNYYWHMFFARLHFLSLHENYDLKLT